MPHWPEVMARRREGETLVLQLRVAPELDFFAGHFPSQPILPGVMQVHWAIHFARLEALTEGEFQALEQ
ncbi:MAG: AMP-binding protein, partial [Burkholderiales bacterium]